jgi:hypothetical protein
MLILSCEPLNCNPEAETAYHASAGELQSRWRERRQARPLASIVAKGDGVEADAL